MDGRSIMGKIDTPRIQNKGKTQNRIENVIKLGRKK
jgi:hypothetical protein